jgi:hypothetical protein
MKKRMEFIAEMQNWFNIQYYSMILNINETDNINKMKGKNI